MYVIIDRIEKRKEDVNGTTNFKIRNSSNEKTA